MTNVLPFRKPAAPEIEEMVERHEPEGEAATTLRRKGMGGGGATLAEGYALRGLPTRENTIFPRASSAALRSRPARLRAIARSAPWGIARAAPKASKAWANRSSSNAVRFSAIGMGVLNQTNQRLYVARRTQVAIRIVGPHSKDPARLGSASAGHPWRAMSSRNSTPH